MEFGLCWDPLEADLGATFVGGLPPVDLGLPGGKLSATEISAAIGFCPEPALFWVCCVLPVVLDSGGELVLLLKGELEFVLLALATETGVV